MILIAGVAIKIHFRYFELFWICTDISYTKLLSTVDGASQLTTKERRLETLDSEYEQRKSDNNSEIESLRRLAEEASQETAQLRSRLATFNSTDGEIKEKCRQEALKFDQVK